MKISSLSHLLCFLLLSAIPSVAQSEELDFRPPAVPLIACDPYFSVWSQADQLWQTETTHWTGRTHRMAAIVRVDGHAFRLMGSSPQTIAAMKQTSLTVLPTRTIYEFSGGGVNVTLTFTTPALPDDLLILSRPTTYVNCDVVSNTAQTHDVEFYFDAGGELASNDADQQVVGSSVSTSNAMGLKIGTTEQRILGKSGDDLRIDWGYLYVMAASSFAPVTAFGDADSLRDQFAEEGVLGLKNQSVEFPLEAGSVVAATAMPLWKVGQQPVSCYVLAAYDDLYSIEYMSKKLRPYWRKDGWEADDLIVAAISEHDTLEKRCQELDSKLMADLEKAGGKAYADIAALAFRQCFAAGKFVADENGQPLQFCKENHSNGCIATSDVFYPMSPQFLLFGPTLTKSVLVPFMDYAASDRWKFPFAPHDLGTYPKANGQVYGGGEKSEDGQMQVEESGNMLILFAALAKMEGNAEFAAKYWDELSEWAAYLENKGYDLDNQLSTDDFAGHMAHNVNLSAKSICGIGSYAMMAEMLGDHDTAKKYQAVAQKFAAQWMKAADDGDHYRLAFDQPGTWSQKYNLVWDKLLGLNLFPEKVAETEIAFYKKTQNEFGLPLDSRSDYTKLDWILWSATLTDNKEDFMTLVRPVHKFLNVTPDRSPMTDWYFTSRPRKRGFDARPVVGAVFLRLLYDNELWMSYVAKEKTEASDWAPMPVPPKTEPILPTSADKKVTWHYTTDEPYGEWFASDYSVASWKQGRGGFGVVGTPGASIGTRWSSSDIWVRRTFTIDGPLPDKIGLRIYHDEDAKVYLNGKLVADLGGFSATYALQEIPTSALQQGENVMAIHCRQTSGGQYIDCGIDKILPPENPAKVK